MRFGDRGCQPSINNFCANKMFEMSEGFKTFEGFEMSGTFQTLLTFQTFQTFTIQEPIQKAKEPQCSHHFQ